MSFFDADDYHAQMARDLFRYFPLPVAPLALLLVLLERHETKPIPYAAVITLVSVSLVLELHPRIRAWRNSYFS